jgi:hypothetical protein
VPSVHVGALAPMSTTMSLAQQWAWDRYRLPASSTRRTRRTTGRYPRCKLCPAPWCQAALPKRGSSGCLPIPPLPWYPVSPVPLSATSARSPLLSRLSSAPVEMSATAPPGGGATADRHSSLLVAPVFLALLGSVLLYLFHFLSLFGLGRVVGFWIVDHGHLLARPTHGAAFGYRVRYPLVRSCCRTRYRRRPCDLFRSKCFPQARR